jgi:PAS domain S-box-containing protein
VGPTSDQAIHSGDATAEASRGADADALLWALNGISRIAARETGALAALREALALFCPAGGFAAGNALLLTSPSRLSGVGVFHGAQSGLREASAQVELRGGQSLAERALEWKSAAWEADLSGDPRAAALEAAGIRSAVACPLLAGGEVAGALELFSESAQRPDALVLAAAEEAAARLGRVLECAKSASGAGLPPGEDRFRGIFESAGVGLALGTFDGGVVRANRAYGEFLGYAAHELAGRNVRELVDAEHVADTMQNLRELQAGRVDRVDLERQYVRRDGTRVWGRTTLTRLPDSDLIIAVVQDVDARKRAEDAVRKLSGRFLHLQDEERRRIARSLHESAAQSVAALSMNLQRMERMSLPPHAAETLEDSLALATQTSREIRTLSHLLHPPLLEEAGLPSSLRWLVQGFGQRSAVEVTLDIADDLGRLPTELEITLFRIVQESLTNVHRHSGSQSASVWLRRNGPEVVLEIADQGIGIPEEMLERVRSQSSAAVGVGIAGMRERLSQLGGTLEILPANPGTLVRASIRSELR